jgi:hypothetical protein
MILQDISRGMGVVVLDGIGNLTQRLLERFPQEARERLIVIDPSEGEHPFSWNPLDDYRMLPEDRAHTALADLLSEMYETPPNHLIDFAVEEMLSKKETTLLLLHDLVDPKARERVLPPNHPGRTDLEGILSENAEVVASITDHGRYLAKDVLMRNILGQKESKFALSHLKEGAIIVVDFSRIRMFPTRIMPLVRLFFETARLFGTPSAPVALYMEDALRYLSPEALEEALLDRTIALSIADTAYGEETTAPREKLLQRAGSIFSFVPSERDVPLVERVFYPYVGPDDIEKLEEKQLLVTLAIDAVRSRPFYAQALPPPERTGLSPIDLGLESRGKYATPRLTVDKLFRPKPKEEEKKPEEAGSFSNAFRSIFSKQANKGGTQPPAPTGTPSAGEVKTAPPKTPSPPDKKAPSFDIPKPSEKPKEIPEADLRKIVNVRRIKPKPGE